jgi:hypothetical protein
MIFRVSSHGMSIPGIVLGVFVLSAIYSPDANAQVKAEDSQRRLNPATGQETSLWAAEPMLIIPTNIDIDSRGRVWVAEGLNYRLTVDRNERFHRFEDADKIKTLEVADGDGRADKRYPLFTGFGGIDSDHGLHGMVLGLDGKLYFSHGDGCCSVQRDHS